MDVQRILKDILKNKYQKVKALNQWNKFGQPELRSLAQSDLSPNAVFQNVPLEEVLSCDCQHIPTKRIIMTYGLCGVGKTTTVQRCALDWAEDKGYSDIGLLFPLTFWELMLLETQMTFVELLQKFFPELQLLHAADLNKKNVWLVLEWLDGVDFALPTEAPVVKDVHTVSAVGTLIVNLIVGNLLPNAHLWITGRHVVSRIIPPSVILKETEIKGLDAEQKEQLFRTIIDNDDLVYKAMNHIRISRSLDDRCEIPPVCAIAATVLKEHVKPGDRFEINPLSLTQIYTRLVKAVKPSVMAKLQRLAFFGKELYFFTAQSLRGFGMNVEEASAISRKWPLLLRETTGLSNTTAFCFTHSSLMAFLAASTSLDTALSDSTDLSHCCGDLVNEAVMCDEGGWNDFVLFFFGLLKERNLLPPTDPLFTHTKKVILANIFSSVGARLYFCLREYDSQALLSEIKLFRKVPIAPVLNFTKLHWRVLNQCRKSVEGIEDQFAIIAAKHVDETLEKSYTDILKSKEAM